MEIYKTRSIGISENLIQIKKGVCNKKEPDEFCLAGYGVCEIGFTAYENIIKLCELLCNKYNFISNNAVLKSFEADFINIVVYSDAIKNVFKDMYTELKPIIDHPAKFPANAIIKKPKLHHIKKHKIYF